MVVQPFDGSLVFLTRTLHDPDNDICRFAGRICDEFAEMIVIRITQLILDDDFPLRPGF